MIIKIEELKYRVEFVKVEGSLFDFLNESSKIKKMFMNLNLESTNTEKSENS